MLRLTILLLLITVVTAHMNPSLLKPSDQSVPWEVNFRADSSEKYVGSYLEQDGTIQNIEYIPTKWTCSSIKERCVGDAPPGYRLKFINITLTHQCRAVSRPDGYPFATGADEIHITDYRYIITPDADCKYLRAETELSQLILVIFGLGFFLYSLTYRAINGLMIPLIAVCIWVHLGYTYRYTCIHVPYHLFL